MWVTWFENERSSVHSNKNKIIIIHNDNIRMDVFPNKSTAFLSASRLTDILTEITNRDKA